MVGSLQLGEEAAGASNTACFFSCLTHRPWLLHPLHPTPPYSLPSLEVVSTELQNPVRKLIQGEQFLRVPRLCREKATHTVLIYNVVFFPKGTEMLRSRQALALLEMWPVLHPFFISQNLL